MCLVPMLSCHRFEELSNESNILFFDLILSLVLCLRLEFSTAALFQLNSIYISSSLPIHKTHKGVLIAEVSLTFHNTALLRLFNSSPAS